MYAIRLEELQPNQADQVRRTMHTFVIDSHSNVAVFGAPREAVPETAGPEIFKSREELERLVEGWTASRLVEIWNRFRVPNQSTDSRTGRWPRVGFGRLFRV
jgi:hypothetical protein